ncbi:uncharacterized protein LOC126570205 [Anopheles aquasalis]|uniref:uncharacterized protein LOC126570205 n=1 Tax=Anopheles aquasalis TaxID=42839 RepID=UPI00215B039B|nr:uncharacterized protein LOC126570205 [Anopheles aquasalis]
MGDIEILRYENRYREQALEVLRKSFFLHEMVCIGAEVDRTPQAQRDLEQLCLDVANGGVSLIARHQPTDTIVGVSFNVLQTPSGPDDGNYFEQFRDTKCTTDSSRSLMQYMITMDAKVNLFERFNVECLLEIMFLATLPDYEGRGIGSRLVEESVRLAQQLRSGEAVAAGESKSTPASTAKKPQLVSALFTSRISQRVGEKNGFTVVNQVPHSEFVYNGKTYADRVGPDHPFSTLVVKHL